MIVIIRRARRQTDDQLGLEDWLWHTIFPFIAYAALLIPSHATLVLFVIGAAAVLFLFIGIHNAWDTINLHRLPVGEREPRVDFLAQRCFTRY